MIRISILLLSLLWSQALLAHPQVRLETSMGNIDIELYEEDMPETVKNFLSYVDSGFYDGTIFNQVIQDTLIMGGGYNRDLSKKERKDPIKNESKKGLLNERGTVAMLHLSSPNTATSEFFINLIHNSQFDYKTFNIGYAVFGKVTNETMGTLDSINYVPVGSEGMFKYMPNTAVEIIKAYRIQDSYSTGSVLPPEESDNPDGQ